MGLDGSWVRNDPVVQPGLERGCHRGNVIRVALMVQGAQQRRPEGCLEERGHLIGERLRVSRHVELLEHDVR